MPVTRNEISSRGERRAVALAADDLGGEHLATRPVAQGLAEALDEPDEVAGGDVRVAQGLVVAELLAAHPLREVGDRGHGGDPQAAVAGEDHLGDVDMPTASAPSVRNARISAGVSKLGPIVAR